MAELSWKEELALVAIIIAIVTPGILTGLEKIDGDHFAMIILAIIAVLSGVLGVKEGTRRANSGGSQ